MSITKIFSYKNETYNTECTHVIYSKYTLLGMATSMHWQILFTIKISQTHKIEYCVLLSKKNIVVYVMLWYNFKIQKIYTKLKQYFD